MGELVNTSVDNPTVGRSTVAQPRACSQKKRVTMGDHGQPASPCHSTGGVGSPSPGCRRASGPRLRLGDAPSPLLIVLAAAGEPAGVAEMSRAMARALFR